MAKSPRVNKSEALGKMLLPRRRDLRASFDARRSTNIGLVARFGAGVLDDPLLVARDLRRSKLVSQLVDLPGELERQLIAVVHSGAGIDADIEGLVDRH